MEKVNHEFSSMNKSYELERFDCNRCGVEKLEINEGQADGYKITTMYRMPGDLFHIESEPNCE